MIKINLSADPPPSLGATLLAGRTFLPLLIAVGAISASLFPAFGAALELRPELAVSQPWRLLTCHLAHWSEQHLAWDLLVFLALAPLLPPRRLLRLLPAAALLISLGVLLLRPDLAAYRGLSGLDSALFAALALDLARRKPWLDRALGFLALALFAAKIAAEMASGEAIFAAGPFVPVPLAHVLGLLAALAASLADRPSRSRRLDGPRQPAASQLCHNAPP